MREFLIREYVERMTRDDINNFAKNNGITLKDDEVEIAYTYIKKDWRTFYYGNPKSILEGLKKKLQPETYKKVELLYIQFKDKIS